MPKKAGKWALFLAILLLLGLSATPYAKIADHILVFLRFSLVIILSVLIVREKFKARSSSPGDTFLRRFRRWYYGDESTPN